MKRLKKTYSNKTICLFDSTAPRDVEGGNLLIEFTKVISFVLLTECGLYKELPI